MKHTSFYIFILLFIPQLISTQNYGSLQTGNQQLRDAIDGAIIRLRAEGEFSRIISFTGLSPDSVCTFSLDSYEEEYSFPTTPVGTLRAALERGHLLVTRPGPDRETTIGDWTTSPPSGPLPELIRSLARVIGENYNTNLTVEYVFTNSTEGSAATYQRLLSGAADMTDADYSITGTIQINRRSVARRQVLLFSCPVISSDISLLYNLAYFNGTKSSWDQLRTSATQDRNITIAAFGTASVAFAQSAFPTNTIIDYTIYGSNTINQLVTDLRSGRVQIVWNFLLTDLARFAPDLQNDFASAPSAVSNIVGYQFRSDSFAPTYVCPSISTPSPPAPSACPTLPPVASPSPCPVPIVIPADAEINFDFSGVFQGFQ